MTMRRRAIPAALELPAQRRERVRQVQYKEEGYVPELPESAESTTGEMAEDETNGPRIRSDAEAEAALDTPPEAPAIEPEPPVESVREATDATPDPVASEPAPTAEPAPSREDSVPSEESLPAESTDAPALTLLPRTLLPRTLPPGTILPLNRKSPRHRRSVPLPGKIGRSNTPMPTTTPWHKRACRFSPTEPSQPNRRHLRWTKSVASTNRSRSGRWASR